MFTLLLLVSISLLVTSNAQECHVTGKVNGIVRDAHIVQSYNECLGYCVIDSSCFYFTFYQDRDECALFNTFQDLDTSCSYCISGETNCPEYYDCDIQGLCNGNLVDLNPAASENECLDQCIANPACEYYAYRGDDGSCLLLENCLDILDCANCHSGERACPRKPENGEVFFKFTIMT